VNKPAPKAPPKAPPKKPGKPAKKAAPAAPTGGPGSRQPQLKLPVTMPDGSRAKGHPLLHFMGKKLIEGGTKTDVAKVLGVRPQSLYKWERECRQNRNFPLPVLRAKQLASYFNVPPAVFRPDFPWEAK
jgi:DNA-binding XRE family transcriptional regulator